MGEDKKLKWGGRLRPAFLGKDFEQDGRRLREVKGERAGEGQRANSEHRFLKVG